MASDLARKWWLLALRAAGILFTIIAVMWMGAARAVLVYVFGAYVWSMVSLP